MVPPTTNSPEGVSKPHGMPAPPLRFLSRIPRDSLPNLNVRPPPPSFSSPSCKGIFLWTRTRHEGREKSVPSTSLGFVPPREGTGRKGDGTPRYDDILRRAETRALPSWSRPRNRDGRRGKRGEGKGGRTVPRDFRNGEAQKPMENTGHDLLRVENISLDKRFRLYWWIVEAIYLSINW